MTTTPSPTAHAEILLLRAASDVLSTLAHEAIHGNDEPVLVAEHAAVSLLVEWGWAVQIATRTDDTPATYRATRAGLIAA